MNFLKKLVANNVEASENVTEVAPQPVQEPQPIPAPVVIPTKTIKKAAAINNKLISRTTKDVTNIAVKMMAHTKINK